MIDIAAIASCLRQRLAVSSVSFSVSSFYGASAAQRRMVHHEIQALINVDGTCYSHRVQLAGSAPTMADILEALHGAYDDAKQSDCPCCGPSNTWPAWADLDKEIVHGL
jgi:hypothetical protein